MNTHTVFVLCYMGLLVVSYLGCRAAKKRMPEQRKQLNDFRNGLALVMSGFFVLILESLTCAPQ
jgi:preprotein translocase subunit YajC